ncbi:CAP domain-containing protein [Kangiella sp. HD9-110m-PIT-SAG07]|nr:CAP domain-containing protein [Kangiella sp. HD9-110m-PIT-SAG07]
MSQTYVNASDEQSVKGSLYKNCGLNSESRTLAKLVMEDSEQLRESLTCNYLLSEIAQQKAEEMASLGVVSHVGPGGNPDQRLMDKGYDLFLPDGAIIGNHVEAVQGGESRPEVIMDKFKNSYRHRVHLFGEHEFFLSQDQIGVGYAYNWDSPHVDYWVVYIASEEKADE